MYPLSLALVFLTSGVFTLPDYYWRDYHERLVPADAFVGINGFGYDVYVAHAPLPDGHGTLVSELYPGMNSIKLGGFPDGKVHEVDRYIQVLCTQHPENLKWVATVDEDLLSIQGLVLGGFENDDLGPLYIGRAQIDGLYQIGKVVGYRTDRPDLNKLYLIVEDETVDIGSYEVLVYED